MLVGRSEVLRLGHARCRRAALLVDAKAVEEALVLEGLLLVDCGTAPIRELSAWSLMELTVCEYSFLEERLPHASRLGSGVDDGREVDQPVDEFGAGGALTD